MKNKRSKATDISAQVKKKVFERDNGACIICGNRVNVMPNSHYIRRSRGGLGIEENVGTMCTSLTENKCHHKYDFGTKEEQEFIHNRFKYYLEQQYENWNEEDLIFNKWSYLEKERQVK